MKLIAKREIKAAGNITQGPYFGSAETFKKKRRLGSYDFVVNSWDKKFLELNEARKEESYREAFARWKSEEEQEKQSAESQASLEANRQAREQRKIEKKLTDLQVKLKLLKAKESENAKN